MHPRVVGAAMFLAAITTAIGALPGTAGGAFTAARKGKSVGSPTEGHLVGGVHLEPSPYLRIVPAYDDGDVRWGLGDLVGLLDRAARAVRHQYPDAVLSVGQLSRLGGGDVERHASHESGRDADVAFYVKNHLGKPVLADHFVAFRGDGTAPSWPGATFDDARNWAFVAAVLNDPVARPSHIFVAAPLRARLLAYAEKMGVSPELRTRAAEIMQQPRGSLPHDDHFHVRIACPSGMRECVENPTSKRRHAMGAFAHVVVPHGRNRGGAPVAVHRASAGTPKRESPRRGASTPADPAPAPASPPPNETGTDGAPAGVVPAPIDDADGEL